MGTGRARKSAKGVGSRRRAESAVEAEPTRKPASLQRSLLRAERGEAGPIRIADLSLDEELTRRARASGAVDVYKQLLRKNASAQPGRPLVNILGSSDDDLRFELLSLYELVLATAELGRDSVQVLLVRLSAEEARELSAASETQAPVPAPERLSPRDIAAVSGFLELQIADIVTTENLRKSIDTRSADFASLVESIRTIGLQNPPVVEVRPRPGGGDEDLLVCVSGHRRLEALKALGQERVICALKLFKTDKHRTLATLAENINRQDLHFLDKAEGYGLLVEQGMSAQEIASLLDSDPRTIGKYLRAARWDAGVKQKIREMGSKATTRFLLNNLAAGERTTEELYALIDKFVASPPKGDLPKRSREREIEAKLGEFFDLADSTPEQRALVQKALKYLGLLR